MSEYRRIGGLGCIVLAIGSLYLIYDCFHKNKPTQAMLYSFAGGSFVALGASLLKAKNLEGRVEDRDDGP